MHIYTSRDHFYKKFKLYVKINQKEFSFLAIIFFMIHLSKP